MPLYLTFPDWIKPEILPGILPVRWYGLMYVVAFALTYWLFNLQVKRSGQSISKDTISNFFFSGLAGMLIGARIFATLIYDTSGRYWSQPWLIFWPFAEAWHFTGFAGMSFHGGLLGVIVGVLVYSRVKKLDLLQWGDWAAAAFPLGYTFGRLGNFINSELWGRVTTVPWGMLFPNGEPVPVKEAWVQDVMHQSGITTNDALVNLPRHPSQLYEAFGEGLLLWLLFWFVLKDRKPFQGFLIGAYLIAYGAVRFVVEYFRNPDKGLDFIIAFQPGTSTSQLDVPLLNFSMGQLLSSFMILTGVLFLLFLAYRKKKGLLETAKAKVGKKVR